MIHICLIHFDLHLNFYTQRAFPGHLLVAIFLFSSFEITETQNKAALTPADFWTSEWTRLSFTFGNPLHWSCTACPHNLSRRKPPLNDWSFASGSSMTPSNGHSQRCWVGKSSNAISWQKLLVNLKSWIEMLPYSRQIPERTARKLKNPYDKRQV